MLECMQFYHSTYNSQILLASHEASQNIKKDKSPKSRKQRKSMKSNKTGMEDSLIRSPPFSTQKSRKISPHTKFFVVNSFVGGLSSEELGFSTDTIPLKMTASRIVRYQYQNTQRKVEFQPRKMSIIFGKHASWCSKYSTKVLS